jgi:hypothetical protein
VRELAWALHAIGRDGSSYMGDEVHESKVETAHAGEFSEVLECVQCIGGLDEEVERYLSRDSIPFEVVLDESIDPEHLGNRCYFGYGDIGDVSSRARQQERKVSFAMLGCWRVNANAELFEAVLRSVEECREGLPKRSLFPYRGAILKV